MFSKYTKDVIRIVTYQSDQRVTLKPNKKIFNKNIRYCCCRYTKLLNLNDKNSTRKAQTKRRCERYWKNLLFEVIFTVS